jgi:hypothetical protein
MFQSFSLGKILWAAVLLTIVVNTVFYLLVSYRMYSAKEFEWDTGANADKAKTKGDEVTEFFASNKYFVYSANVLNLTSALLVVTLLYVG